MSGTGNDFVVIDNRNGRIRNRRALARRLCDRHGGIGADGLLLLESSAKTVYTMRYYNADGTDGGMCGNGGRCIAWFAFKKGIAGKRHEFTALTRVYEASVTRNEWVSLKFPSPGPLKRGVATGQRDIHRERSAYIDTGSPHVVISLPGGLNKYPVTEIGRTIRNRKRQFPAGTNVNFIEIHSPGSLSIRTYERGVEAETMACGTGSIACSLAGVLLWGMRSPVSVRAPGGMLRVSFRQRGQEIEDVRLAGSAKITFEGMIDG